MAGCPDLRERLTAAVRKVRRSIQQVRDRRDHTGETQTKTSLITPVLDALGWDTVDPDEVKTEYRYRQQDNPVDYALLVQRSPVLFVEAKALDTNLDDHKWKSQVVNYANAAGVEWCVLSDGDRYCIYNAHAPVDVEQKLFRSVAISNADEEAHTLDTLELLSKPKLSDEEIIRLWRAHFVDRQVRDALEALLAEVDEGLVRLVRRQAPGLSPSDIRGSLRRADVDVQFPQPAVGEEGAGGREGDERPRHVPLGSLMAAGLMTAGDQWRAEVGDGYVLAEVAKDGDLLVDGQPCGTPSQAGARALGLRTWHQVNGWDLWHYQDAQGAWRPVAELRERLRSGEAAPPEAEARVAGAGSGSPEPLAEVRQQTLAARGPGGAHAGRTPRITLADLLAAGLARAGDRWHATTQGREVLAQVTDDGHLSVEGERFATPSAAGSHATGWQAVDGWQFWSIQDSDGTWQKVDELRKRLTAATEVGGDVGAEATATAVLESGRPGVSADPVEVHFAGRPQSRAVFTALVDRARKHLGPFSVHANSKHVVLSGRYAFAVVKVLTDGLRIGLRLEPSEAERIPRLIRQPNDKFEGWSACHVSTVLESEAEVDEEFLALLARSYEAAG